MVCGQCACLCVEVVAKGIKYEALCRYRMEQAKRSILIHESDPSHYSQVCDFCHRHGPVAEAFSYTQHDQVSKVISEYHG
jgi:hypothetical protein